MRELKEQVTDELLPRAFSIRRDTRVWIDCKNGWLVIDAASQAVADEVRGLLVKSIDQLPLGTVRVTHSPVAAMTEWLLSGEGPAGFTLDQTPSCARPPKATRPCAMWDILWTPKICAVISKPASNACGSR